MSHPTPPDTPAPDTPGLALRLRAATQADHGLLDKRLMAFNPFADLRHYRQYLQVQYRFHRDVDALFLDPFLNRLLPGLSERRRFPQVGQDLADLGDALPAPTQPAVFAPGAPVDLPVALGWLYVEEGSNLGGALLFKLAARLGLDERHGARHLAPHPQGRAPSWKVFMGQLDAAGRDALGPADGARAETGARAAFGRVQACVERFCQPVQPQALPLADRA